MNGRIKTCRFSLPIKLVLVVLQASLCHRLVAADVDVRPESQQYVSKTWDNARGLPVNSIFKMLQDEAGFLWISTEEGLVRFDGMSFKVYNAVNTPRLNDSWFIDIAKASDGGIWAANSSAIVYARKDQFTIYNFGRASDDYHISSIEEGYEGEVWVGTQNGALFRSIQGVLNPVSAWDIEEKGAIKVIRKSPEGMVIGTADGLFIAEKSSGRIIEVPELKSHEIRSLAIHPDGSLWVGTRNNGIIIIQDGKSHSINMNNGLVNNHVNALHVADNGQVWAGMSIGGVQLIRENEVVSLSEEAFGYNEIRDIFISKDASVWLTVVGHGLIQMSPSTISNLGTQEGLSSDITLAVYQDNRGVIWTGTAGAGVNRIEDNKVTHITKSDGLKHNTILGIYGAGDYLYIGTGDGLHLYNSVSEKIESVLTSRNGLASSTVQAIYQDRLRRVWVATRLGGIHRLGPDHQVERLPLPESYSEMELLCIFEDSRGNIWVGTSSSGLLKIDADDSVTAYPVSHGPSSEMVLCMWEDPEGDLWVGTNQGLAVRSGNSFRLFSRSNGLHFNGISGMVEDDLGYLWLSGNFGIQQLAVEHLLSIKHDKSTQRRVVSRLFDTSDGMANQEANGAIFPAGWKMKNGEVWFPTMGGIAIVDPQKIHQAVRRPDVYISSLHFGGQEFDPLHNQVSIPPGVHSLEVRYGAVDFDKPQSINYSYRLKNIHEQWEEVGNRGTAYFSALGPGDYLFEVKAEKFGISSEISSCTFTVEPYFYQTIWFKGIVVLMLFLSTCFVIMSYLQRKLSVQLKEQVDKKTMELADRNIKLETALKDIARQNQLIKDVAWMQSHQLRGPLARILGLMDVVKHYDSFDNPGTSKQQLLDEIEAGMHEIDRMLRSVNNKMEEIEKDDASN